MTDNNKNYNVLLIHVDDLNDWVLHPADHPQAKTPNIDRLRAMSVSFDNAHAVVPVCGPSRNTMYMGFYPQRSGSYSFSPWFKTNLYKDSVPMQQHFYNNGYRVYGTGKLFHEGKAGDFYDAYGVPPEYGPWPWKGTGDEKWTAHTSQTELFAPFLPVNIHRDLNFGPLSDIPDWKPDNENSIPGYRGWRMFGKPFHYNNDEDRDKMPDELSTDFAVDVLSKNYDKPFFLGVGYIRPHSPLYVPKKYYDMYPMSEITLPPYKEDDLDDCAKSMYSRWQLGFDKFKALIGSGGEEMWKKWVQGYLACLSFLDDQVGRVMDALDKSPYKDNTIIVFVGDQGYHIGEKSTVQKWYLWEESTHAPLFIHVPGMENGAVAGNSGSSGKQAFANVSHPVSLIDIYPTLIDLCDLPKNPNAVDGKSGVPLDGHSLRPFFENPETGEGWTGPDFALSAVKGPEPGGPCFSIRSEKYRYTLTYCGEEEMYDHSVDPNEWNNVADDPAYADIKVKLKADLMGILNDTKMPEDFWV